MDSRGRLRLALLFSCITAPAFAGFASSEQYLAAVGRVSGANGAELYTTVWATNLTSAPVSFTFEFLKQGQSNTTPASFSDNLAPGQTKVYENVVESKLGIGSAIGAARIVSTGEILVAERISTQASGADVGSSEGLFFAGVPKSFSISLGQSASIQGINQGASETFRYNFALVETGGGTPTVNVQLFDGDGTLLGQRSYVLQPHEQIQPNVADVAPLIHTTNARITATVTGGAGSVLIAGAQIANAAQGSSGFEMSFRGQLLGGTGTGNGRSGGISPAPPAAAPTITTEIETPPPLTTATAVTRPPVIPVAPSSSTGGVTSLNGLTGGLAIAPGANTTVNVNGSTITIDAVSGSGTWLTAVAHDGSLSGSGTASVPLGIAPGQAVRSLNGLHDAVTLAQGNGISIIPSGATLTIAATGGGSGSGVSSLNSLTGAVSITSGSGISVMNSGNSIQVAYTGGGSSGITSVTHDASLNGAGTGESPLRVASNLALTSATNDVIVATSTATTGGEFGVVASSSSPSGGGVHGHGGAKNTDGYLGGNNYGVYGIATDSSGVGVSGMNTAAGTSGYFGGAKDGVYGETTGTQQNGVHGKGETVGVFGESTGFTGIGVQGNGDDYGIYGFTPSSISGYGVFSNGNFGATGTKSFVEPHPTDPSKEIRYVSLEGPEAGTYFRGKGRIVNGFAMIEVPDHFRTVSAEEGITVQLTPVGDFATLVVKTCDLHRIVVSGNRDVSFFYTVNGIRRAFADFQPISENRDFVPRSATDTLSATGLPAESVRRLKASGILNDDGTVNLETARRLGWDQRPGWNAAATEKDPNR